MATEADILSAALTRLDINKEPNHQQPTSNLNVRQLLRSRMLMVPLPVEWKSGITLMVLPCNHSHRMSFVYITCRISDADARKYSCPFCGAFVLRDEDLAYLDRKKDEQRLLAPIGDDDFWKTHKKCDFGSMSAVDLPTVQVFEALENAFASLEKNAFGDVSEIKEVQIELANMKLGNLSLGGAPRETITLNDVFGELFERAQLDWQSGLMCELQVVFQDWVMRTEALLRGKLEDDVDSVADALRKMMVDGA